MNHFSNKNLLLKIKSGNKRAENEALQLIYQRELPRLYEYYRKSGLTYEYLQDIFQDALSTLYQQVTNGTFREETSISNYMKVLSRNIWCNHQRKIKKVQLIRTQAINTSLGCFDKRTTIHPFRIENIKVSNESFNCPPHPRLSENSDFILLRQL